MFKKEWILVFDLTQKDIFFCILSKKFKIKDYIQKTTNNNLSENIDSILFDFLLKNKIEINNISSIYFNAGPGLFTGIRIAYCLACSMKLINKNLRVYAYDTCDVVCNMQGACIIDVANDQWIIKGYDNNRLLLQELTIVSKEKKDELVNYFLNKDLKINNLLQISFDNYLKNTISILKNAFEIKNLSSFQPYYLKKFI